jgi:hypothetical protein
MGASDVAAVLGMLVCLTGTWAYNMDLAALLKSRNQAATAKRAQKDGGNPCADPETPFPCKGSSTCIPMGYVCDEGCDCEDCYDENTEVCTALSRPPVVDIMNFLDMEKSWILPTLFGNKPIAKIAHGLAVSQTVDDFKRRLNLNKSAVQNLRHVLEAVKHKDEHMMEELGMPQSAWQEVFFIFNKLVKSNFQ